MRQHTDAGFGALSAFSIERGVDRGEVLAAKKKTEQEHCNLPNGQGAIAANDVHFDSQANPQSYSSARTAV